MRQKRPGWPDFYVITFLHVAFFGLLFLNFWSPVPDAAAGARKLWYLKTAIELMASFYLFSVVLKSWDYLLAPESSPAPGGPDGAATSDRAWSPVAIIYLCAGDLDERALESLCRLQYPGRLDVLVHDDAGDADAAARVDRAAARLARMTGREVTVLRRPARDGGKPGAVNYVLARLAGDVAFVLLADNDSTAVDPAALVQAVPLFDDPRVGAAQFRNVGVPSETDGRINRHLVRAIDMFDLFARHQSRHGMALFFGHNALLRRAALDEVGGLRPGVFADDIDLSIRLVRAGRTIVYAPGIRFGETHPASYAAFRKRAYKWAFGCGQILRAQLVPALRDRRLSLAQKLGLLEFLGFYSLQSVLILYLVLVGLVLPVVAGMPPISPVALAASGSLILAAIFLPALSYFWRRRQLTRFWPFALVCAVVYGSVAFSSARGLMDGLAGRRRRWVPTNLAGGDGRIPPAAVAEAGFGLLLFLVPAFWAPATLWQPSLYLFATVFLLTPFTARLYVPDTRGAEPPRGTAARPRAASARPHRRRLRLWHLPVAGCLVIVPLFFSMRTHASLPPSTHIAIRGERFYVDGEPLLVKGIHYSPWLPGTGPMKQYAWPAEDVVARDLGLIRSLGANTILVHDAPVSVLRQAQREGLLVVYAFYVNWQSIGDDAAVQARTEEIVRSAAELAKEPNLLAIVIGNEVVEWVLKERGAPFIESRLKTLHDAARAAAPGVPIGHANWPIARQLELPFMDFAAFNLYPSWPREVAVAGYGDYIENVLKPIAGGRPLLITEFGQNTLEASEEKQARLLQECWREIQARTAGGVVFSFADEWWKNYDNPVDAQDWWKREYAPDDEKTHDLDPEEYYGILTSGRDPKRGAEAVREMFGEQAHTGVGRVALWSLPLLLLVGYTLWVFRREPAS